MSTFNAFMKGNELKRENIRYIASNRFITESGKPEEWEITAITTAEDDAIRKDCTQRVPIPGKKYQFTTETNYSQYLCRLAARCTVYPNLNDAELQNSYGIMGAENLLREMLLPGEYAEYLSKVQEVNGFDVSTEELVDEAKNS